MKAEPVAARRELRMPHHRFGDLACRKIRPANDVWAAAEMNLSFALPGPMDMAAFGILGVRRRGGCVRSPRCTGTGHPHAADPNRTATGPEVRRRSEDVIVRR